MSAALQKLPQHIRSTLIPPLGRKISALEIRDFLTGKFEPLPLMDLMNYLRAMEKAGTVELTPLAERPARK
ncbi:MAG: hypothetical protein ABI565_02560 [Vicinamibacteria bacterium]